MRNMGPRSSIAGNLIKRLKITLESPSMSSALICSINIEGIRVIILRGSFVDSRGRVELVVEEEEEEEQEEEEEEEECGRNGGVRTESTVTVTTSTLGRHDNADRTHDARS